MSLQRKKPVNRFLRVPLCVKNSFSRVNEQELTLKLTWLIKQVSLQLRTHVVAGIRLQRQSPAVGAMAQPRRHCVAASHTNNELHGLLSEYSCAAARSIA